MRVFASCITSLYLLALGITIGGIIACGALSAPVIFNASEYLAAIEIADPSGITRYASGILMTEIFARFNYLLNAMAIFILVYELLVFNISSKKSLFLLGIGIFSVVLIFLFTMYYTPAIIAAQADGAAATATEEFYSLHTQSEMIFQILLISLSASFLWRVYLLRFSLPAPTTKSRKK
ncbi:DUF4149 domain-containing protein [Helicobacter zhangjianzhongii]|uniref:DUF4149 domain-containing protein n=1 Tax=Helicobacter zhangjianzhongii TaxID=2974574 RepID=A0ACC6FUV8_9HELI|nr:MULTISPECIES: DUF4149 domain-containing protein [unclassified Helicobacter]MDL0081067.1 DUF4149 domain-containing protein [Helicobacter sp. CPD2-1]MDL0083079.1 DUF4149 domain-containing protein [Helicobacter sp. XJK30-2]